MWRWGEDGHLQAKERGLRKVNPADTLILDVYPSELSENEFLLFKLPSLQYFVENPPKRILQGYSSHNFFNSSSRQKHKCLSNSGGIVLFICQFTYMSLGGKISHGFFFFFLPNFGLYFSKFPHFIIIKFPHCIRGEEKIFIIREKRRQKEQLWRRLLI